MATGNSIVFVLDNQTSSKMFPFDQEVKCLLPLANANQLETNLSLIRKYFTGDIHVLTIDNPQIKFLCSKYDVDFKVIESNPLFQLGSIISEYKSTVIINDEPVLSNSLAKDIIEELNVDSNKIYISNFDDMRTHANSMGVNYNEQVVTSLHAHARAHYVNAYSVGMFKVNNKSAVHFTYSDSGFDNINTGQMPDNKFHIENVISKLISEQSFAYELIKRASDFTQLKYSFEIVEANEFVAKSLFSSINIIGQNSVISDNALIKGTVVLGNNSKIGHNVIIEGNCWIGNNVTIENGVIIGNNVVINDNSVIKDYCKVNDNTIIGKANKIGFNAEIGGVTFEGVSTVHNSEIYGVIGKHVDIAAGVQFAILRFDDQKSSITIDGHRYQNHYTDYICIGNYSRTGVSNIYYPGVRVGSQCAISPGVIVSKNVGHNTLVKLEQQHSHSEWGSHKYGW